MQNRTNIFLTPHSISGLLHYNADEFVVFYTAADDQQALKNDPPSIFLSALESYLL